MAFRERLRESRKSEMAVRKDPLSAGYTRKEEEEEEGTFEGTQLEGERSTLRQPFFLHLLETSAGLLFYVRGKSITLETKL